MNRKLLLARVGLLWVLAAAAFQLKSEATLHAQEPCRWDGADNCYICWWPTWGVCWYCDNGDNGCLC